MNRSETFMSQLRYEERILKKQVCNLIVAKLPIVEENLLNKILAIVKMVLLDRTQIWRIFRYDWKQHWRQRTRYYFIYIFKLRLFDV